MRAPGVTVIICTRNRPRQLDACLDAIVAQQYRDFDILVIDNGDGDAVATLCRRRGVACVREPVAGLTRARNRGARTARGHLVAYIDDDAVAEPTWLATLVAEFDDREVAAAAGRTRYVKVDPDTERVTDEDALDGVGPRPYRRFDRHSDEWFGTACLGGIGDGNTMMFRRELLLSAVRFDERIGRGQPIDGGDEHLAFMSLIADGYTVVHVPAAVVRHPSPSSAHARRAKRRRDLRGSVAYILFLLTQFPRHRRDTLWFLGRRQLTRVPRVTPRAAEGLALLDVLVTVSQGVMLYVGASRQWTSIDAGTASLPRVVSLR
jgi:glycosyltransferase involved in cell wall biosynthesis